MTRLDSWGGKTVLTIAHVCGMIDLVAPPLWIGTLMQHYGYSAARAGITLTLFLLGVVLASAFFAPRFNRMPRWALAAAGFSVAAAGFIGASMQPVAASSFVPLLVLHVISGLGVGCALSFTHGGIGRSANPHRLFALVNVALGVFAVIFLAATPQLIEQLGASALFQIFGSVMAFGAVVMAIGFPSIENPPAAAASATSAATPAARMPTAAWFVIGVVICMTMNQAMVFSFVERIGAQRGFGAERVQAVLIALGLVNLTPGVLAALLQKKWSPIAVGFAGPVGQAVLALTMSSTLAFASYAFAASLYVFMMIFTHTFLFGLLTRLDPSGRAAAATPAMMMLGSCIGPALGGGVVQGIGYEGLGWAACAISAIAVFFMVQVRQRNTAQVPVARVASAF